MMRRTLDDPEAKRVEGRSSICITAIVHRSDTLGFRDLSSLRLSGDGVLHLLVRHREERVACSDYQLEVSTPCTDIAREIVVPIRAEAQARERLSSPASEVPYTTPSSFAAVDR